MNRISILLAAALLSACGVDTRDRTWSKPGATEADFKRDSDDCYVNATTGPPDGSRPIHPVLQRAGDFDILNKCMRAKGWQDTAKRGA
jgi:hypothetical protein